MLGGRDPVGVDRLDMARVGLTLPAGHEACGHGGALIDDLLRNRRYFLGGLLPRWFDEDGMLLQKISGRPNWDDIRLHTDAARRILADIGADFRGRAGTLR